MAATKKPGKPKKPTQAENFVSFTARIEQMTPVWLAEHESRRTRLAQLFDTMMTRALDEETKPRERRSLSQTLASLDEKINRGDQQLYRVTAVKEQVLSERGLYRKNEPAVASTTTNNYLSLNIPSGLPAPLREELQRHALANLGGEPEAVTVPAEVISVAEAVEAA